MRSSRSSRTRNITLNDASISDGTLRGHYAGFVSRLLAFAIDLVIILLVQMVVLVGLQLTLSMFGLNDIVREAFSEVGGQTTVWGTVLRWVTLFVQGVAFFGIYLIFFWTILGKTIGQAFLGLLVIGTKGQDVTFWMAVRRAIGYYLSFLPLAAGFLWILADDRRQGWHDKLAGTVVIYEWNARLGRRLLQQSAREDAAIESMLHPVLPDEAVELSSSASQTNMSSLPVHQTGRPASGGN